MSYRSEPSGWAVGGVLFAGVILLMVGIFQALTGLVAIFEDTFFVVGREYTFEFDVTAWGWIHLIVGAIVAFAGYGVMVGQSWARGVALVLAMLSAVLNFLFIPYYPFWALVVIALDVFVIWALTRPSAMRT